MNGQDFVPDTSNEEQSDAQALALGDLIGVRMMRMPSVRSTSSNGPLNLESRSRMRKRTGSSR